MTATPLKIGFIGCEYKPATTTEAGLGWLEQARQQVRATD